MEFFQSILRFFFGGFLSFFEARHPLFSLAPLSLLAGVGMLWGFRHASNQAAIRRTKKRLQAHLLELRLFSDEPALIWRAQKNLWVDNLRFIGLMLRPALLLTVPLVLPLAYLDGFYGWAPLAVDQAAIVTVQMKRPLNAETPAPALQAPAGIAVETPAVRVLSQRQISWRIRPLKEVSGKLTVALAERTLEKEIDAGRGPRDISVRRASSVLDLFRHPREKRLPDGDVDWIEVSYPSARVRWWGLDLHWLIWFVLISMISALLLKRRFRVAL